MDLEKQRRNILTEINEQIVHGNKALDEMRKRTKNIIETETMLKDKLESNNSERSEAKINFEELLDKENELYELQLEAQEKLIDIQSMRSKLESSVSRSYPRHKIYSDKVSSLKNNLEKIHNEEETQKDKLRYQIKEYERMKSEADMLNRLKRSL